MHSSKKAPARGFFCEWLFFKSRRIGDTKISVSIALVDIEYLEYEEDTMLERESQLKPRVRSQEPSGSDSKNQQEPNVDREQRHPTKRERNRDWEKVPRGSLATD